MRKTIDYILSHKNDLLPKMVQVLLNLPKEMSIAFDIQVTAVFSRNLNRCFLAMGEWNGRLPVVPTYPITSKQKPFSVILKIL